MKQIPLKQFIQKKIVDRRINKFSYTLLYDQKYQLMQQHNYISNKLTKQLFIRYMNNSKWYIQLINQFK